MKYLVSMFAVMAVACGGTSSNPPPEPKYVTRCGLQVLSTDSLDGAAFQHIEDEFLAGISGQPRTNGVWTSETACSTLNGHWYQAFQPLVQSRISADLSAILAWND